MYRLIKFLTISLIFMLPIGNIAHPESKVFKDISPILLKNFEVFKNKNVKIKLNEAFAKNKSYLINFWATWCIPCKKELPDLTKIYNSLDKEKIKFYIVSIDKKNINEQLKYLEDNKIKKLTPLFDPEMKIFNFLKLRGIPTTIMINKNGYIVKKHEGILVDDFKTIKAIKDFIN